MNSKTQEGEKSCIPRVMLQEYIYQRREGAEDSLDLKLVSVKKKTIWLVFEELQ